jgi:hypothetical protein
VDYIKYKKTENDMEQHDNLWPIPRWTNRVNLQLNVQFGKLPAFPISWKLEAHGWSNSFFDKSMIATSHQ